MIAYAQKYGDVLVEAFLEHLSIVAVTLLISIMIASAITAALLKFKRLEKAVIGILGAVYSIPSLALFAVLIPLTGIGKQTALIVLIVYNQFLLLRNFTAGIHSVDEAVVESAYGIGMNGSQVLLKIKLPLAFPVIMAGINLAVISTIGIATIAATINAGGIGRILLDGLRTQNMYKIIWGTVLSASLAIGANILLGWIEKHALRTGPKCHKAS